MEIASGVNSQTETVAGLVSVNWVIGITSFTIKAIGPIAIDDIVIGNDSSGGSGSEGGGNDGGNQGKKEDNAIYCHNNGEISASKNSAHADHGGEY